MSHYNKVRTAMKKTSALVAALQNMGFSKSAIEVSETLLPLRGYRGDTRKQQAHIRLKGSGWRGENVVGGSSNDLGWERMENGEYSFHVSDFDKRQYGQQWQENLVQQYGAETVKEDVYSYGWSIEKEEVTEDERLHLVIDVPYVNQEGKTMAKVDVYISKDGTVTIEVNGVQGKGCQDITKILQESLGVTVDSDLKPEYFVELEQMEQVLYETED